MSWLVTGGAGYIGSHIVRAFSANGIESIVLDDLSTGRKEFVPDGVAFVQGSICSAKDLDRAFEAGHVDGVVHLAGFKYAGESVKRPLECFHSNVEGTRQLLEACARHNVMNFVFSSSAAVFGTPDVDLVDEQTPTAPESPYGESKLIGEWLCRDFAKSRELAGGSTFKWTALRYFNVVGSGAREVYDVSPHNLFPLVMDAVSNGRNPKVFGNDYPTPDGTCVRDYIHVQDVAEAHVAAAKKLQSGTTIANHYNLGRGEGVSVKQIMEMVAEVTGIPFTPVLEPRRAGDPARIVTSSAKANADLGWVAIQDLEAMVDSAWSAWQLAAQTGDARLG
jgi:UDP-glucose 4-epimerase